MATNIKQAQSYVTTITGEVVIDTGNKKQIGPGIRIRGIGFENSGGLRRITSDDGETTYIKFKPGIDNSSKRNYFSLPGDGLKVTDKLRAFSTNDDETSAIVGRVYVYYD